MREQGVMKSKLVIVLTSITGALTGWTLVRGSVNLFQERRLHGLWIRLRRMRHAPGKDGATVDMMSADVLFDVWCALFEVC